VRFFSSHIIAILAAILFPVFAKAREKARQASCLSNLKQLGVAFHMYQQDYDSIGPQRDVGTSPSRFGWSRQVEPYVKNSQMFICPSSQLKNTCFDNCIPTSYGYSFCWTRYADSTIKSPAELVIFADWRTYGVKWNAAGCGCSAGCVANTRWREGIDTPPHNEGINMCMYDGHAKWLGVSAVNGAFMGSQRPFNNL